MTSVERGNITEREGQGHTKLEVIPKKSKDKGPYIMGRGTGGAKSTEAKQK